MTGWLLDTNVVAELASRNGAAAVQTWADGQQESELFLSILTIGEYLKGIHNLHEDSSVRNRIVAALAALEVRFAGRILPVSNEIVRRWGKISGAAKRTTRQSPPVLDTLLAATAIQHDLCLVTRNLRDVQHSGALVFDPWTGIRFGFEA